MTSTTHSTDGEEPSLLELLSFVKAMSYPDDRSAYGHIARYAKRHIEAEMAASLRSQAPEAEVAEITKFLNAEGDNSEDEWAVYAGKLEDRCRILLRIIASRVTWTEAEVAEIAKRHEADNSKRCPNSDTRAWYNQANADRATLLRLLASRQPGLTEHERSLIELDVEQSKMLGEPDNIALANALTKALAIIDRLGEQAQPPKRIDTVLEKAQQVVYEYEVAMPSWNKGDYKYLFAKALVDGQKAQPATVDDVWTALRERCCASKPATDAKAIVMLRRDDLKDALSIFDVRKMAA